jgi:hypothetical protein
VLAANGDPVTGWSLPRTFEPYYPTRALRGQSQSLGFCFAQTVVLGHRGQATVRRLADGSLRFDFVLPPGGSSPPDAVPPPPATPA